MLREIFKRFDMKYRAIYSIFIFLWIFFIINIYALYYECKTIKMLKTEIHSKITFDDVIQSHSTNASTKSEIIIISLPSLTFILLDYF